MSDGLPFALPDAGALRADLAALHGQGRAEVVARLGQHLEAGRAAIRAAFEKDGPAAGRDCVARVATLTDQLVTAIFDLAADSIYPVAAPSMGEQLCLVAVGGYGRGEMAPFSDVDILFLLPWKAGPRVEQICEYVLYCLWDLKLKVGQAVRPVEECLTQARADQQVLTGLLELRFLSGEKSLFNQLRRRLDRLVKRGDPAAFVDAKLAERDARHQKLGDSRYQLEPNVKEGKGGLRDLQTLVWIANYIYRAPDLGALVGAGVLTGREAEELADARDFLWTVRCWLHWLAGRPDERLSFDNQRAIAEKLGFQDQPHALGVELFMRRWYQVAKHVGDLTRIFCAALEFEASPRKALLLGRLGIGRRQSGALVVERGRIDVPGPGHFRNHPLDMLRLFQVAEAEGLDIHPRALRALTRSLGRIDDALRADPAANAIFLDILTGRRDPALALRRMNEAGLLGRFVPEFGHVVGLMQFDRYHAYTVDEHTLFVLDNFAGLESGRLAEALPFASHLARDLPDRRAMCLALFCHDIAKGQGGDHSVLGEGVTRQLGARFGLDPDETDTAAWLVREHLTLSRTTERRDIEDGGVIAEFAGIVQSPERLRLLTVLTICDIRAVGPGRLTQWKLGMIEQLYDNALDYLTGGLMSRAAETRRLALRAEIRARLDDWGDDEFQAWADLCPPGFWAGFDADTHARLARLARAARDAGQPLTVEINWDETLGLAELTVLAPDHPGLFSELAGAISLAGGNIVAARIYTLADGLALDQFQVETADGPPREKRWRELIEKSVSGRMKLDKELASKRAAGPARARVLPVAPRAVIDNGASPSHSVIEVAGRDRPGFLYDVTRAMARLGLQISLARIATFGEKAVDVFYVKDVFGLQITHPAKLEQVRRALMDAAADPAQPGA